MLDMNVQRQALEEALADVRSSNLRKLCHELAEPIDGRDEVDVVTGTEQKEFVVLRLNRKHAMAAIILTAASKLGEGPEVYASCSGCDGTIEEKRLLAVPWTIFCIGCQEMQDRGELEEFLAETFHNERIFAHAH